MARESTIIEFGAVDRLSPALDRISKNLGGLSTAVAAVAAGSITALVAGVSKTIGAFEELGDAAIKLNVSAEALSGLGFAARQSGADAATLQAGLQRLNKTIGEAANGNKTAADLFDKVGVSIRDSEGKVLSADKVYERLADRFKEYGDGAQEAALGVEFFGRSVGPKLLQNLNLGSEGIQELKDDARELGQIISTEAAEAAKLFGDNLDRLKAAGEGFFNSLTTAILPALVEFSTDAAEAAQNGGLLAKAGSAIGEEFNRFAVQLILAGTEIEKLGAFIANSVQFLSDWAENLGVAGSIAVVTFQSIAAAAEGNFALAERGANAVSKAIEGLGNKAARDAAVRVDALAGSLAEIDESAAAKVNRIRAGVEGLGRAAGAADDKAKELADALLKELAAAAEAAAAKAKALAAAMAAAAANAKRLADAAFKLKFLLADGFAESLRPTTVAMQEFDVTTGRIANTTIPDLEMSLISASSAFEGFGGVQTVEAAAFQANWEDATNSVQDALTDLIVNGLDDWDDFGKSMERIAKQFLGNLVKQFLSTNLSVGGGSGGGGGSFAQFSQSLNSSSMFGPGGTGATVGGSVNALASSYAAWRNAGNGGSPLVTVAGGAQAGQAIGGEEGAVIGAIIGGLVAIFRRQKPPDIRLGGANASVRNPEENFNTVFGSFQLGTRRINRTETATAIRDFDAAIARLVGSTDGGATQLLAISDRLSTWSVDLRGSAATVENVLGQRFDAILSTFSQDVQDFVNGADTLEGRVDRLQEVLNRPAELRALIDSLEDLNRASDGLSDFERALGEINKAFNQAIKEATALGASQLQLARIEELRTLAIERLNAAQRANLDALLDDLRFDDATSGLTANDRAIADINRRFDALRDRAKELGATQADLELIERRRTAALRDQADATRDSIDAIEELTDITIRDEFGNPVEWQNNWDAYQADLQRNFLNSLSSAIGGIRDFLTRGFSVSSESPLEALARAQGDFESLTRRSSAGDIDAIRGLGGSGDALLRQAASFYGVGSAEFQAIERAVRGTLTNVANTPTGSMAEALAALRPLFQTMIDLLRSNGTLTATQTLQVTTALRALAGQPARAY